MKPIRERSDDVGPGRLGSISSFNAHGKEGLLPASDECWMVVEAEAFVAYQKRRAKAYAGFSL